MPLAEILKTIESPVFQIEVNVASDLRTFLAAVREHLATRQLIEHLTSPSAQERVLNRVFTLSRQSPDPRYENPSDTPLGVYLFALSVHDVVLAGVAAQAIGEARQCWWASKMAEQIVLGRNVKSFSADEATDIDLRDRTRRRVTTNQSEGAGESVITAGLLGSGSRMKLWSRRVRIDNQPAAA
jgi:hypothetical protein